MSGTRAARRRGMTDKSGGMDRREFLRRSAIVGGTVAWMTPVIQSISPPAAGAATPSLQACCLCCNNGGQNCNSSPECGPASTITLEYCQTKCSPCSGTAACTAGTTTCANTAGRKNCLVYTTSTTAFGCEGGCG